MMGMKKRRKKIYAAICIGLALAGLLFFPVQAKEAGAGKSSVVRCAAFGDSIAKGYAGAGREDLRSYSELLMELVSEETGIPSECVKHAKNGLDSSRLNSVVFHTEEAVSDMECADILTLTIGANDLLQEFKGAAQEVLGTERRFMSAYDAMDALMEGVEGNPLLIMKVLDVLNSWDYEAFEEQWVLAMDTVARHRKESAQLVVTNIYNPVSGFELPGTMNEIVEDIILNMNEIMYKYAKKYDYYVVDLFSSDICGYLQEDGLHPSQEGQELIASLASRKIDTGRFIGQPEKEIQEEPRAKREARRRFSLWNILGPVPFLVGGALILTAVGMFALHLRKTSRRRYRSADGKKKPEKEGPASGKH